MVAARWRWSLSSGRCRHKHPVACELLVDVFQQLAELDSKPVVDELSGDSEHARRHVHEQADAFILYGQLQQLPCLSSAISRRALSTVRELAGRIIQLVLKKIRPEHRQQKRPACNGTSLSTLTLRPLSKLTLRIYE